MSRRDGESSPFEVERIVESEHRAGVDLAWIVVFGIVLCGLAIAFAVPDQLLGRVNDIDALDLNGIVALVFVLPAGASLFALRRYRDAIGAQRQLTHLSLHDALTGLPNRRHLREVIPASFVHARRHNTQAAVLFIDLDGFKVVNDTYGHEVGDELMKAVAERLRLICEPDCWAARYAGDEFVLIDPAPHTHEAAKRFAIDVVAAIEVPFELGEDRISISASVGVSFGDVTDQPEDVLSNADTAMYASKSSTNRVAVYSDAMRLSLTPVTAERRLQAALNNGEFKLLFQPIVALRTGAVVGAEGLLRWDDPTRGEIAPLDFLSALEDTGLIVPVGRWVFAEACRQARRWADLAPAGANPLRVTVNVSPRQLSQVDFIDDVAFAIEDAGVEPGMVYLEFTESALIGDPRAAWSALARVRELGVGLALDDFGTGFSSLTHLRTFDLDLLKLDGSYTDNLGTDSKDDATVRHILSLARALGIATLAEGVAEPRHIDLLLELGCELGQGYYFARPMPASMIDGLVSDAMSVLPAAESDEGLLASSGVGAQTGDPAVVLPRLRETAD